MPRRTRKGRSRSRRPRRSRSMSGGSVWGSLKSGFNKANNYLKKTGVISKVAGVLDKAGVPYAGKVHNLASKVGYGRRRRRRRARTYK